MTILPTTAKTTERRRYTLPPGIEPAPDILDDDMPDPMFQHPFFFAIIELLTAFFENRPDKPNAKLTRSAYGSWKSGYADRAANPSRWIR